MRGNITRRGKSSSRLKFDVGTSGQRQIAYVTVRGTKKQAEEELAKRLTDLAQGRYVAPTVEDRGELRPPLARQYRARKKRAFVIGAIRDHDPHPHPARAWGH